MARNAQMSIRLHDRDKAAFLKAAEESGLDPSVAVRQLIEIVVRRVEAGGDLIDAIYEMKNAPQQRRAARTT